MNTGEPRKQHRLNQALTQIVNSIEFKSSLAHAEMIRSLVNDYILTQGEGDFYLDIEFKGDRTFVEVQLKHNFLWFEMEEPVENFLDMFDDLPDMR